MTKKEKTENKLHAIAQLRKRLKVGQTIYTVVTHASASGMSRSIKCVIVDDSYPEDPVTSLDGRIADALGYQWDQKHGGVKVSGCGMDMGFHLVYNLGATLWPDGTPEPHGRRNGQPPMRVATH